MKDKVHDDDLDELGEAVEIVERAFTEAHKMLGKLSSDVAGSDVVDLMGTIMGVACDLRRERIMQAHMKHCEQMHDEDDGESWKRGR